MKKLRICLFAIAVLLFFQVASVGTSRVFAQQDHNVYIPFVLRNVCQNEIPNQPATSESMEAETLRQINLQRQAHNLDPVRLNESLVQIARFHSIDMAENDFFSHTGSEGESPWDRYDWLCEKFGSKGEIIGAGYTSAREVVLGWMDSPDHRAIILNPNLTLAGVGYTNVQGSEYGSYWTVNFATK